MEGRGGDRGCSGWGQRTLGVSSLGREKKVMSIRNLETEEKEVMSSRSLETEDRVEKKDRVLGSPRQKSGESFVSPHSGKRQLPKVYKHRDSLLPLRWRLTHSIRWKVQMLSAELSLIAFILLLVMVFSKRWLCLSMVRFYQRWPASVSSRIHTSVHIMSMGLLDICIAKNCPNSENGKGETLHCPVPLQASSLRWPLRLYPGILVPSFWSSSLFWHTT